MRLIPAFVLVSLRFLDVPETGRLVSSLTAALLPGLLNALNDLLQRPQLLFYFFQFS
jgi:hypothetical protein